MRSLPHLAFCHWSRNVEQYLAQRPTISAPKPCRAKNAHTYQVLYDTLRTHAKFQHGSRLRLWVRPAAYAGRHRSVPFQFDDNRFRAEKMAELEHAAAQGHPALQEEYKSEE